MYDKSKIIPGLVVFVLLALSPILLGMASGQAVGKPQLKMPDGTKSVESTEYMRAEHMQMLLQWRDDVVRNNDRVYVASDGKQYEKSLTGTCLLQCHTDKQEFCDKCHDYAGVSPNCWSCHVVPEERK